MPDKPRVLCCITVYNGKGFVERALESAFRFERNAAEVDILVLDDCSPAPGWSEELGAICSRLEFAYYRSPHNIGIPRNVNLGLRAGVDLGYDYVIISNSDVIYPSNLVNQLVNAAVNGGDQIGSITALTNSGGPYSLPNQDPDRFLTDQDFVDWISNTLVEIEGENLIQLPTGVSYCMLIPTDVIRQVGLMDPIYGRGYCEESDWSCRCYGYGKLSYLMTGVYLYHMGRASTIAAGVLKPDVTGTVPENEAILASRYPDLQKIVTEFRESHIMDETVLRASRGIVLAAIEQFGYEMESASHSADASTVRPLLTIQPDKPNTIQVQFRGFRTTFHAPTDRPVDQVLQDLLSGLPMSIPICNRRLTAYQLFTLPDASQLYLYPTSLR